jgi:hypothetical protein
MPIALRDEALKLLDGRGAILDAAREISAAMREAGVEGAVVGGVAVVLHGHVRTTVDIDIYSSESPERLIPVLESLGFLLDRARREFVRNSLPVHIVRPQQVVVAPKRVLDIDGVRTVSLADLIAMKLRSGLGKMTRAQDLADVVGLIRGRGLKGDFARRIDPQLRPAFRDLVRAVASDEDNPSRPPL